MGILICGLNGTGKSTLGRMLADRMGYEFIDNEDLFFPKTDPSYTFSSPRSEEEVIRLLEERISVNNRFIFAAVRGNYGDKLIASLDRIVLIEVPKQIRSQRVRDRSYQKFGDRILPGGDLYEKESRWFSLTDSRPETYVTDWLEKVDCPVIRIDGTLPVEENVEYCYSFQDQDREIQKTGGKNMFRPMRRYKQQISREECIRILRDEKRGVLSMIGENGYPYGIPLNHWYNPEDGKLYFHGAKTGHKLDALRKDNRVSYCVWDAGYRKEGEWALNVNSVIVFGRISLVIDEKKAKLIGINLCRKFTDDEAYIQHEIQNALPRVQCLELTIDHMTGKLVNES